MERTDQLRVVLVATRNPLNIGAAARAMSNFGVQRLRVVRPYETAFREARSAVGASVLLKNAEVCSSVAEAVADCSLVVGTTAVGSRQLEHPVHRLEAGASILRTHLDAGPAALLFGSEKRGLSNDDLSHCHWLMRIPTREQHDSMNLGQAVAVCLYELVRNHDALPAVSGHETAGPADSRQVERMTIALLAAMSDSGYTKPGTESATEEKMRRLVRRLHLAGADAEILTGIFAKMRRNRSEPTSSEPDMPKPRL